MKKRASKRKSRGSLRKRAARKRAAGKKGTIFRAWITLADGTRRYARDYGLRGFPILDRKAA